MRFEFLDGYRYIRTILRADAQLLTAPPSGVSGRVYSEKAPASAPYPFVVIQYLAGSDLMGVGPTRLYASCVFMVKVVGQVTDYLDLEPVANRIEALLHATQGPAGTSGGLVLSCVRESADPLPPEYGTDGKEYRSIAGRYRLGIK